MQKHVNLFIAMFRHGWKIPVAHVMITAFTSDKESIESLGLPVTSQIIHKSGYIAQVDYFRKVPLWVLEHYTNQSLRKEQGVSRQDVPFKPDALIPIVFQARNEDYLKSGYSRGHMAPAAAHKVSQQHMDDTFHLSNIIPQDFENNKNYWASLENWSRSLVNRGFEDVWVLSGPCWMPDSYKYSNQWTPSSKDLIKMDTIGNQRIAVPSHLYKVIVAKFPSTSNGSSNVTSSPFPDYVVAAFLLPNAPIPKNTDLRSFEVPLFFLEQCTGIHMFPQLNRSNLGSLCTIKMANNNEPICWLKQK
eukprot:NODE_427_length_7663_cov_0.258461.p4 type:complete len:303 gc:universal NODE_427_length_7663_cov_0.258461:3692-4600(+)